MLERIASSQRQPDPADRGAIIDTLRYLKEQADGLRPVTKKRLERLPLWTSRGSSKRPVYAALDRGLDEALSFHLPVWTPGVSIATLDPLPAFLGVEVLGDELFNVAEDIEALAPDEFTVALFRSAVAHLKTELATSEPELWDTGDWEVLERAELVFCPDLQVVLSLPRRPRIRLDRDVHSSPSKLYFKREEELGGLAGRRALSRFFSNDQREVVYAWTYAWHRAEVEGPPAAVLESARERVDDTNPLEALAESAKSKRGKPIFAGGAIKRPKHQASEGGTTSLPEPRRLKNFGEAIITEVALYDSNGVKKTVKTVNVRRLRDDIPPPRTRSEKSRPARADWSDEEKERLGFELLAGVIQSLDGTLPQDYRAIRHIGADSVDELKRFFELKAHLGEIPNEVRLQPSQVERAVRAGKDFFLVVVGGLEEGRETAIRIVADPLTTLEWRHTGIDKLVGIREAGLNLTIDATTSSTA